MKRLLLPILTIAACIFGVVAQNDAMFVYRNDGAIHAFLKSDVDSIRYSHVGLDGLVHREFEVQEVWTADSVYRIPLAAIDSVSFVAPPTIFKSDVVRLDETFLDYIVSCDSLTLKLEPNIPVHLLPLAGDKLVLLDGCEALPYGFSGIVSEVKTMGDGIDVVCEQAYLEDIFDSFCSVSTMYGTSDTEPMYVASNGHPDRVVYSPGSKEFKIGPFSYDVTKEISAGLSPDSDLALKGGVSASLSIDPTFRIHTLLIMGEEQGTYFSCSITGDINVESNLAVYSGIEYSHDLELEELKIPIPGTYNLLNFYIVPGFFGRMGATVSASVTERRTYALGMAYDYSSIGANVLSPSLRCRLASSSREFEGSLDGSLAAGAFLETGFNLLSRDLLKVYVSGEYGWQINGSFVLRNSDIDEAEKDTKLYERLKASSIETGPFGNVSMGSSALNSGPSMTLGKSETLKKWDVVPTFSDTKITRSFSLTSADVSVQMSGDCLFPQTFGVKLFDDNKYEVADFNSPDKYTNQGGCISHSFSGVDKDKKFTVYPKVKLFGYDILASPSAELDSVSKEESFLTCPDDHHPHAIDLGLPSGTLWSCCNAGASKPEEYGEYYSFENTVSAPSREQFEELLEYTSKYFIRLNGVLGVFFKGHNGGEIFLPRTASYHKPHDGTYGVPGYGLYWSSTEWKWTPGELRGGIKGYALSFGRYDNITELKCGKGSVGCYNFYDKPHDCICYFKDGTHYCYCYPLRQVR